MSRLDDELRQAFRRETPSADFAQRVLKAVAAAPAPKRKWWDELLSLLVSPKGRLVAVGVAASLLILLWVAQTRRFQAPVPEGNNSVADNVAPRESTPVAPGVTPGDAGSKISAVPPPRQNHVKKNARVSERRLEVAKSEGLIAKEQLMLALHIAGASLNEAQRLIKAGN